MATKPEHGTAACYNQGCRYTECRQAGSIYHKGQRQRRAEMAAVNPDIIPHGTVSSYSNYNCRCEPCSKAKADSRKSHT